MIDLDEFLDYPQRVGASKILEHCTPFLEEAYFCPIYPDTNGTGSKR